MKTTEQTEERERMRRLVCQARDKDAHAFSLLYEMVYQDLYRMALYTLGNPHDAEDIVSETVLDAYRDISSLRDETAFRGWIFRILSCKCKKKQKSYIFEREHRKSDDSDLSILEAPDEINSLLDRQEIAQAFSILSPEERLIVTMVVYAGYNSREIASILHKKSATIRSKYHRALEKMQHHLE